MTQGELAMTAIGTLAVSLLVLVYLVAGPGPTRLSLHRRRPGSLPPPGLLSRTSLGLTSVVDRLLRRRGSDEAGTAALEQAGIKIKLADFALLVIIGTAVAGGLGVLLAGPLGVLFAVIVPVTVKIGIGLLTRRRQRAFADQLEDALQLMSSSLRAGHSMLQSLNSVAQEAEAPTSEEFTRIINEVRVGREPGAALEDTARRMQSEDFTWVTQAIAINREVGGNLAEVLDSVAGTIRDRNQIRRQVKSLSAEGTMSAWVLMGLPVGIVGFLSLTSRSYLSSFAHSWLGYLLIAASVALYVIGGLWMRKTVQIKF